MTDTMRSHVLVALGTYRFSVRNGGLARSKRDTKFRHPEQDAIGMLPPSQFVGPGTDTQTLDVTIYPQYRGGIGQVDDLRSMAGLGTPLVMVDGNGVYYGEWVIESISDTKEFFLADGTPRKIEFSLEIKKYA